VNRWKKSKDIPISNAYGKFKRRKLSHGNNQGSYSYYLPNNTIMSYNYNSIYGNVDAYYYKYVKSYVGYISSYYVKSYYYSSFYG